MPPKATPRRSGRRRVKEEPPSDSEHTQDVFPLPEPATQDVEMQEENTAQTIPPPSSDTIAPDSSQNTEVAFNLDTSPTNPFANPAIVDTAIIPPKTVSKFKPRAGRRTKEAREADEKAEAERRAQKAAEAGLGRLSTATGSTNRGRGGSQGGSRGMSSHPFANPREQNQQAYGPFGGGTHFIRPTPRTRGGKAQASIRPISASDPAADTTTKAETTAGASTDKKPRQKKAKAETVTSKATTGRSTAKSRAAEIIYLSSDDSGVEGQRRNIEEINLVSSDEADSDDDPIPTIGVRRVKPHGESSTALRPVRVERYEHVSRAAGLTVKPKRSASTDSKAKQQTKTVREVETIPSDEDPEKDPDLEFVRSDPKSEVARGKARQPDDDVRDEPQDREETARPKSKPARKVGFQHLDAVETVEEREEQERHVEGVESLKEELASMGTSTATDPFAKETQSEEQGAAGELTERNGRLYLFQLPPLTPMLFDSEKETASINGADPPSTANNGPNEPSTKDTKPTASVTVKKEEGTDKATSEPRALTAAMHQKLPDGRAGKLKVHKSGRVTMEWGEVDMEVHWGSEVDFLQDALLATPAGEAEKTAWSLSQVKGKMVVTPNWEKMFK